MKKLLLTAFACAIPLAAAAAVTQDGADRLKTSLSQSLETRAQVLKKEGITLNQTGTMMAEVADNYYAITTPEISMTLPGGVTRNIGMVAINANPENGDANRYRVAVAMPTPINDVATATPATVLQSLVFGQQSFSGIYDMAVQNITSFDATYKDVSLTRPADALDVRLPELKTSLALAKNGTTWAGPWDMNAQNFSYTGSGSNFGAASLRTKIGFKDVDFSQKELYARIGDRLDADASTGNATFTTATGLKGTAAQGTLKAQATGLKADKGTLDIDLTVGNIAFEGLTAGYGPTSIAVKARGSDLPVKTIITKARGMTPKEFSKTLGASGGSVVMERFNIEAAEYGVNASGNFKTAAKGFYGLEGNMKLRVRNPEKLTQWLNTPDAAKLFGGAVPPQVIATFAIVQLTGQPGSDEQGRPVKTFDLTATANGKLLLNGTDITSIAGKI